jgi:hypothetical protein
MTDNFTMRDSAGRIVTDDDFDESGRLKDGHSIRLPVMLLDAAGNLIDDDDRPPRRSRTKEEVLQDVARVVKGEARAEMIDYQSNAWRAADYKPPPAPAAPSKPSPPLQDVALARDAVENARRQMIEDTCNAWKRQW